MPTCVKVTCDAKDKNLFDKALKKDVLDQMGKSVKAAINGDKSGNIVYDDKCKDGWLLTASLDKLSLDDPNNPKTMEAKISIKGVQLGGTAKGFDASGDGKVPGVRPKKLKDDAAALIDGILEDVMKKRVLPHITKP